MKIADTPPQSHKKRTFKNYIRCTTLLQIDVSMRVTLSGPITDWTFTPIAILKIQIVVAKIGNIVA